MTRSQTLILAGVLALGLVAPSPPRLVGDGREYLAQAIEFASFRGPAIRPADIPHIQSELARFDPSLAQWDIWASTLPDSNRGRQFLHFWFYALLAAPGVRLATALGAAPTYAFAALNLFFLGIALWVTLPRVGAAGCVLLFAGPIVWWIDKAHTEIFTFSLLTIALAEMDERPWWSMMAAALASTQNPPIAILVPIVLVVAVMDRRPALRDRRVIVGAAAALALALLHPVYTYLHYGTASLLLVQTRSGAPTLPALSAVVLDPSIGLVGNFPAFLIVVIGGVVTLLLYRGQPLRGSVIIPAIVAAIFLVSFSRTTNMHHGGTPGISRYALWLIPLSVPVLALLDRIAGATWRRFLWAAAVISAVVSIYAFRPSVPQNSREPTWLATFLWTRFPAFTNPLPEVFVETQLQIDELQVPVATSGCEKILFAGGDVERGVWPSPCYPAVVPEACQTPGQLCYANFTGRQYDFALVRGATAAPTAVRGDVIWPGAVVTHVRRLYDAWDWPNLHASSIHVITGAERVSLESLGSNDRFVVVLRDPHEGARIRMRPATPMQGVLIDPFTGQTLQLVQYRGESDGLTIDLPNISRILLLAMRAEDAK